MASLYSDDASKHPNREKKSVRDTFAKNGFTRSIQAVAKVKQVSVPDSTTQSDKPSSKDVTIGIVGAGAAGLYAALILESLGIKYEILEGSNRVGGRIYTHHFSDTKYDYFDVGAMRFPRLWFMRRLTIHLFDYL